MMHKIICNRCGFREETTGISVGILDDEDYFGDHNCPDGEIGEFIEEKDNMAEKKDIIHN